MSRGWVYGRMWVERNWKASLGREGCEQNLKEDRVHCAREAGALAYVPASRLAWHLSFGPNRSVIIQALWHLALLPGCSHTFDAGFFSLHHDCVDAGPPCWTWRRFVIGTVSGRPSASAHSGWHLVRAPELPLDDSSSECGFGRLSGRQPAALWTPGSSCGESVG